MKNSFFILPLSFFIHLITLNVGLYLFSHELYTDPINLLYYNLTWLICAYSFNIYAQNKFEKFTTKFPKLIKLIIIYGLCYFCLFAIRKITNYSIYHHLILFIGFAFLLILYKYLFYLARTRYRTKGGKYVKVIVIGRDLNLRKLRTIFDQPTLGYKYIGYFDDSPSTSATYLGETNDALKFAVDHKIDEIYCIASKFSKKEFMALMTFADNHLIKVKLIPDNKEIWTRSMSLQLYGSVPVLNMRESPLEMEYANIIKRMFDVVFSSLVIIFILSWLIPIIYIVMRIDSKGPLFFIQERHGANMQTFKCIKFRSMTPNKNADTEMAKKNDMRVTKLGKFMRKTNIDELPQFINVFMGDMSVVGPRPHMVLHTKEFEALVNKYLVRHFVKPGITGLAQVRGYRGEIEKKSDLLNRVRLDIFYLEKWSPRLDILIIYYTILNVIRGEKKAY
ncbi:exopolysaccharide biosynthesis polyprenyl glycosylphosphotransferase [Cellulophaga tyrosinoxydans]|uniref:Putative colanic acid biosysnthesis UDP-glucose lipid carrier transferase n=1 Tax=Cellulophaga tyrosinoxydans TaxID=504486 RepID=A0A1W2AR96_9FLAO|nr:exopolysaccharide biosynthesis polyprenyl glycosylphosphotransferase [Cellulophaga tyrosinoxydans]SMC62961.1 putative colanic acid biosysnthesis UDP-glucose lipid carrier transferase [Cellulophaga tyrosinoxydans]